MRCDDRMAWAGAAERPGEGNGLIGLSRNCTVSAHTSLPPLSKTFMSKPPLNLEFINTRPVQSQISLKPK